MLAAESSPVMQDAKWRPGMLPVKWRQYHAAAVGPDPAAAAAEWRPDHAAAVGPDHEAAKAELNEDIVRAIENSYFHNVPKS
jgi:hypothetical protein